MALRGLHVVVLPSEDVRALLISFVLCSRGEECPMAPMITRSNYEDDTILQDALMMALRRATWTHEYNMKMNLRAIFWHAKDFAIAHEVAAGAWKVHRRSYDCFRCPHEWPDMARCIYDQSRIWNFPSSCVHLMSTSGQCDAGITLVSSKISC